MRFGQVARPPSNAFDGYGPAARALECSYCFQYRDALPGAEIHRDSVPLALQGFQCRNVAARQIDDMDVVANAGAVARRIIAAENAHAVANAHGNLSDIGHQIVWDTLRIFADQPARVCAYGIEVSQQGNAPSAGG